MFFPGIDLLFAILYLFLMTALIFAGASFVIFLGKRVWKFVLSMREPVKEIWRRYPHLHVYADRYPKVFSFARNRLRTKTFTGLSLTLLIIVELSILFLFFALTEEILDQDVFVQVDFWISDALFAVRSPVLNTFFLWVTNLGSWPVLFIWAVGISLLLFIVRKGYAAAGLWITLLGTGLFTTIGKVLLQRARPEDIQLYLEQSFSFPSGHSAAAMAFYGFLSYAVWRFMQRKALRFFILFVCAFSILSVGLSRVYLGVHYISDVAGGYLMGLLWILIGVSYIEWKKGRKKERGREPLMSRELPWVAVGIGVLMLFLAYVYIRTYFPGLQILSLRIGHA